MSEPPADIKRIICLANSRKISGRCIAGKEIIGAGFGSWVRPVSQRESGEVSIEERRYQDGRDPKVLDIISIPIVRKAEHRFQTENYVLDDQFYWVRLGRATKEQLFGALDAISGPLWNVGMSSYNGINDRMPDNSPALSQGSLRLIRVADLTLSVGVEGAAFGNAKRKVRGRFSFNGQNYLLSVTDNVYESAFLRKDDCEYSIGNAILCVSLGEPYKDYVYKIVASIIRPSDFSEVRLA